MPHVRSGTLWSASLACRTVSVYTHHNTPVRTHKKPSSTATATFFYSTHPPTTHSDKSQSIRGVWVLTHTSAIEDSRAHSAVANNRKTFHFKRKIPQPSVCADQRWLCVPQTHTHVTYTQAHRTPMSFPHAVVDSACRACSTFRT